MKGSLNSYKAFLEDLFIIKSLSASLCFFVISDIFFDVWNHACIENRFSIRGTVVGRV